MTVYNITKLSPNTAKAIAKYYGVNKVSLRYSDLFNMFSAIPLEKSNISANKRLVVKKYLAIIFENIPIETLKSYPKIERKK